jgi:hypothetical protein
MFLSTKRTAKKLIIDRKRKNIRINQASRLLCLHIASATEFFVDVCRVFVNFVPKVMELMFEFIKLFNVDRNFWT